MINYTLAESFVNGITNNQLGTIRFSYEEALEYLYSVAHKTMSQYKPLCPFSLEYDEGDDIYFSSLLHFNRQVKVANGDFEKCAFMTRNMTEFGGREGKLEDKMIRAFLREENSTHLKRENSDVRVTNIPSTAVDTCMFSPLNWDGKNLSQDNELIMEKKPYDPGNKGQSLPTWVISLSNASWTDLRSNRNLIEKITIRRQALARQLEDLYGTCPFELVYLGLAECIDIQKPKQPKQTSDGLMAADWDASQPKAKKNHPGSYKIQIFSTFGLILTRQLRAGGYGRLTGREAIAYHQICEANRTGQDDEEANVLIPVPHVPVPAKFPKLNGGLTYIKDPEQFEDNDFSWDDKGI
jgi:hypothetical protein